MGLPNCHGRWCPLEFKNVREEGCKNVTGTYNTLYPDSTEGSLVIPCCQLYCGQYSQLLQLQCQGISRRMAFLTWIIEVILIVCVGAQLLSVFAQRGGRKVAIIAGPMFLAFISVIVYVFTDADTFRGDTPHYPVVGAMSVAAFSYFFSSFKYSIHLADEIAPAIVLLFSMLPFWTYLTVMREELITDTEYETEIRRIMNLVTGMLVLSILWVIHSILFRTVGYRADWIRGYNSVHTVNLGDNHMCRLWVLGGAQGQPTWRTPAGQCIGIYLAVVSWFIALAIYSNLTKTCHEDLVLFHIMLWVPPASLTVGVMATQLSMCKFQASCIHKENHRSLSFQWTMHDFLSLVQTYKHMEAAVISYRLGRNCLQIENHIAVYRYNRIVWWDWFLAQIVFFIEIVIFSCSYPGIFILRVLQTLGVCVVKLIWKRTFELDMKEKNEAYRTLCEHCLSEDIAEDYKNSGKKSHIGCLQDGEKDLQVQEIFRNHRMNISLPLLLDNISPARLAYLLHQLDFVLKENPPRVREEVIHLYKWIKTILLIFSRVKTILLRFSRVRSGYPPL